MTKLNPYSLNQISLALFAALIVAGPAVAQDDASRTGLLARLNVPHFVEQSEAAGIVQSYVGGWEFFVGGGGTSLDCNHDQMPDLALAGGAGMAGLYVNRGEPGGALSFEPVVFGPDEELLGNVLGIYALDIDGDRNDDLVLLRLGENVVMRGTGDCAFEPANALWHIDGGHDWTTAFSANWEAGADFPTLAFGNYVDRTAPGSPWGTCADNYLMRPMAGSDAPDYSQPQTLSPGYCALSMLFTDWNRSGERALRITNDRQYYRGGEEQMWKVAAGEMPRLYDRADGWEHLKIWGMGIAAADLNSDGVPEYALTSMGDTKLQALETPADTSRPHYVDLAYERGATAQQPYTGEERLPSTGWHAEFADFNNDGLQDLFIAKGNVEAMPDFASFDPDNMLLQRRDGSFIESGDMAGIARNRSGRGAVVEDFNRDGLLDLLVVNRSENVSLFRNMGGLTDWGTRPLGNWVEIEVRDDGANHAAVGARLLIKTGTYSMNRTISVGGGHAAGHSGSIHVGLGLIDRGAVRVQWPDGTWSHDYRVLANQHVIISRSASVPSYQLIE